MTFLLMVIILAVTALPVHSNMWYVISCLAQKTVQGLSFYLQVCLATSASVAAMNEEKRAIKVHFHTAAGLRQQLVSLVVVLGRKGCGKKGSGRCLSKKR